VITWVFRNLCKKSVMTVKVQKVSVHVPGTRASIITTPVGRAADRKAKLTVPSSVPALTSLIFTNLPTEAASSRSLTKAFRPMVRWNAGQKEDRIRSDMKVSSAEA
jgi:hypothetical protein